MKKDETAARGAGMNEEETPTLNAEHRTPNVEVTDKTVQRVEACDQLARARDRADEAWKAAQEAEKTWMAAAKGRTPEAWRQAVDGISDRTVRIHAACIVWWDFFGARPASSSWTHLDDYKSAWKADRVAEPKSVRKALRQIGYPERLAERRVKIEEPA